MKTLLTAAIVLTLSGTAFAGAEINADTIPGYGVESSSTSQQLAVVTTDLRAESIELTTPGYGVIASYGSVSSQPSVGSVEVDYLGLSYQGAN